MAVVKTKLVILVEKSLSLLKQQCIIDGNAAVHCCKVDRIVVVFSKIVEYLQQYTEP